MIHSEKHFYTILSLLLSSAFIFVSMVGMNIILRADESRLLSEGGKVIMESPVRAREEAENNSGDMDEENSGKSTYIVTSKQMDEAIDKWNSRTGEIVHNPVTGQISMEEAIQTGELWLADMEMEESGEETDAYSVNATLGIPKQNEIIEPLEPYYSFWTVRFTGSSMNAVLYINAVTGKVLGAEVCLYRNLPDKFPVEKLSLFVEWAGLQENDTEIVFNSDGTSAFLEIADSHLCAEMGFQRKQKGYFDLTHYEQGNLNADSDIYYNEYVVITYKLTVGESKMS